MEEIDFTINLDILNEWWVNFTQIEEKLGSTLVQKVPKVYNKRSR